MAELNLRNAMHTAIKRIHDRVHASEAASWEPVSLKQDLENVQRTYDRFLQRHNKVVELATTEDELTAHADLWEQTEILYTKTCVWLRLKLRQCATSEPPTATTAQNSDVKLDPVVIPAFDGAVHNWLAFKDIFECLVHKGNFPEAYKLSKLRQAVSASNVPLVGNMYSGGYEELWAALKERYDNKKILAEVHVSRFLNMRPATEENVQSLLAIVDTVQESMRALSVMGLPVKSWDALAVPIIVNKLPSSTQREWCMVAPTKDIPKLSDLLQFLETRAHSLNTEYLRVKVRSEVHRAPIKAYAAAGNSFRSNSCPYCSGQHRITRCQSIQAMSPTQRSDALKGKGLQRRKLEVSVEGIGACSHTVAKGKVFVWAHSTVSDFSLGFEAFILPFISSSTPATHINTQQWPHLADLSLADPSYGAPGAIDILIGADVWGLILRGEVRSGAPDQPHAQRTHFGWVVFGPAYVTARPSTSLRVGTSFTEQNPARLEDLLQRFWTLEEVPQQVSADEVLERFFMETHSRTAEGRYVVRLMFRPDSPQLGQSYATALRQFHSLERRLLGNPELCNRYVDFMREYSAYGHMTPVDQPGDHERCYYIPHHAVMNKFRVVFNASARTANGLSLNDLQSSGPTIQDSLINVIFRFRRFRVAITADIEKMFRQVLVSEMDRDFQRILWRESTESPVTVYRLNTITYGMACSPYLAVRTLHQCALDNGKIIGDASKAHAAQDAILNSFYVDDFLASRDSLEEAVELATDVRTILSAGHFHLRKWNSNSSTFLRQLCAAPDIAPTDLNLDPQLTSVLGLSWDPVADQFQFKATLKTSVDRMTKRSVLGEVARLFDPTGLLVPVVIIGKIFMQTLWSKGVDWDTPLTAELADEWLTFRNGLTAINQLRIPRWLGMSISGTTIHGFCDASPRAYAAVLYARTTTRDGQVHISLITSRSKVAPLKEATIPRLELCAAHLLARTLTNVRKALEVKDHAYYLWSDSNIVLCWLRKHPTVLKPYVSNRVREVQELTAPEHWRYVRSAQNPADCASRGLSAAQLCHHRLWWNGPEWLKSEQFPAHQVELNPDEYNAVRVEEKILVLKVAVQPQLGLKTRQPDGAEINLTERFSCLQRLLRTVEYVLRWSSKAKLQRKGTVVQTNEYEEALMALVRIEQQNAFSAEIQSLRNNSDLPATSRLLPLNPFLDEHQILRLGGRIASAAIHQDQRFPMILPRSGALIELIVRRSHVQTLHGGTQLMLHTLRQKYWILNGRQVVRSFIHRCTVCRRARGQTLTQQMSALPIHRIRAARPFSASGVDYCGPFTLRIGAKRSRTTVKTYLAIFVCMVTKAVHIEVIEDLSSAAFLDAFSRFVNRRGPCRHLYSDNATTFVGANRKLKDDVAAWQCDNNQLRLAAEGTEWHFIAPRSPHQGGLWEAAVKSAKRHLTRLVGAQGLWYHQMHTLATRIEACLNSRPLYPLHDDPADKFALSPADFLIGEPLVAVPEPSLEATPVNRIKQWQYLRQIQQNFWRRWTDEYLTALQLRNKWKRRMPNVRISDVVIIREDNIPPTHWRLGRITALHPGSDGLVRNVSIKTAHGIVNRAIQKVCLLLDPDEIERDRSTGQDV